VDAGFILQRRAGITRQVIAPGPIDRDRQMWQPLRADFAFFASRTQ